MTTSILLLLIFLALAIFPTPQAAPSNEALNYWKSFYPTIPIPPLVSQHMSQMSDEEINTVISLIRTKTVSPDVAHFCKTANLICSTDEISEELLGRSGHFMPSTITVEETKGTYFHESTLKKGTQFNMGKIKREMSPAQAFLPHSIASLLTIEQSGVLFQNTTVREVMSMALNMCNTQMPGEIMKCASSVEELLQFTAKVFPDKRLKVLYPKSAAGEHTTVILDNIRPLLRENSNAKFLACHQLFFPYTIMYCHAAPTVQVYQVDLVDSRTLNTINTGMIGLCHPSLIRSRAPWWWTPNQNALSVFKTLPGNGAICHWMSTEALLFVHLDDTLEG